LRCAAHGNSAKQKWQGRAELKKNVPAMEEIQFHA